MLRSYWPCVCPICHAWPVMASPFSWCLDCQHKWQNTGDHRWPLDARCESWIYDHYHALSYQWPWKSFILSYKAQSDIGWSYNWAMLMNKELMRASFSLTLDWIGMPQSPQRWAQRGGYDPIALIIKTMRQQLQKNKIPIGKWIKNQLIKKETPRQHHLSKHDRWQSSIHAFDWVGPHASHPQALLIDDVLTTGATLTAASKTLKKIGYESVFVLTLARTPLIYHQDKAQSPHDKH